jgi:hypothetical protein
MVIFIILAVLFILGIWLSYRGINVPALAYTLFVTFILAPIMRLFKKAGGS